jgi:hypothetical protein
LGHQGQCNSGGSCCCRWPYISADDHILEPAGEVNALMHPFLYIFYQYNSIFYSLVLWVYG